VEHVDLDEPRNVAGIIAVTVRAYARYPALFAILALAVMGPFELAVLAATGHGPLRHSRTGLGTEYLLLLLRTALITPLISALHMHAVVAMGEGERPELATVAKQGLRVLPVVAAAEVMADIGIALGFIALIVPGIILSLRWAVVAQAAALEREGWLSALRSSAELTRTHYLRVFGLLLLTGVFGLALHLAAESISVGSTSGAPAVAVGIVVDSILASLSALTLAFLYFALNAEYGAPAGSSRREHPGMRDLD
jgi:hypothetical protein